MAPETRTPVHENSDLTKFLRILWRLAKLAYILLGKEFGFEDKIE